MRKVLSIVVSLCLITIMYSCVGNSGFSNTPEISYISISKDTMNQGNLLNDSLTLSIYFKDGDGDIGTSSEYGKNIRLRDSRTMDMLTEYKTPPLPLSGASGGIEGTISLKLYSVCCAYEGNDDLFPCASIESIPSEELHIEIQLIDDAGNVSNTVRTDDITILCN